VVEILDPIPPGLPKAEFLQRLIEAIETASERLQAEARAEEQGVGRPVNL
jgi:1-acyl-sn-glycerol-3-phosphate acyltransferase